MVGGAAAAAAAVTEGMKAPSSDEGAAPSTLLAGPSPAHTALEQEVGDGQHDGQAHHHNEHHEREIDLGAGLGGGGQGRHEIGKPGSARVYTAELCQVHHTRPYEATTTRAQLLKGRCSQGYHTATLKWRVMPLAKVCLMKWVESKPGQPYNGQVQSRATIQWQVMPLDRGVPLARCAQTWANRQRQALILLTPKEDPRGKCHAPLLLAADLRALTCCSSACTWPQSPA
eukprot:1138103-Pelagomonas_calceolata.AAC.10